MFPFLYALRKTRSIQAKSLLSLDIPGSILFEGI
jgi:hypothetical protein